MMGCLMGVPILRSSSGRFLAWMLALVLVSSGCRPGSSADSQPYPSAEAVAVTPERRSQQSLAPNEALDPRDATEAPASLGQAAALLPSEWETLSRLEGLPHYAIEVYTDYAGHRYTLVRRWITPTLSLFPSKCCISGYIPMGRRAMAMAG